MGNYLSSSKDTSNAIAKLIWYDNDNDTEETDKEIIYIEHEKQDVYVHTIYKCLNILISKNIDNSESYKVIRDYLFEYNVKLHQLLEKKCMCYFLFWELKPFLKQHEQREQLEYIFTKFKNHFGWDFKHQRY